MSRKRFYELKYKNTGDPIFFEDAGNLLKISGILLQGMGSNILVLLPTADKETNIPFNINTTIDSLSLDELSELIRITDDPQVFEQDDTGSIKAIHRKVRSAISGAIQQRIWVRDGLRCLYCGRPIGEVPLTVDHFMPLELSGENNESNYITSCRADNKRKGNMHPMDWCRQEKLNFREFQQFFAEPIPKNLWGHVEFGFSHLK